MKTKDIIAEVLSLPVEERAFVADSLLKSLNTPDPELDKKWISVAKRRLFELRTKRVAAIPGEKVFNKIWNSASK